jgi:hypothetical protein
MAVRADVRREYQRHSEPVNDFGDDSGDDKEWGDIPEDVWRVPPPPSATAKPTASKPAAAAASSAASSASAKSGASAGKRARKGKPRDPKVVELETMFLGRMCAAASATATAAHAT